VAPPPVSSAAWQHFAFKEDIINDSIEEVI
jgi:hypothetical protein